MIDEMRVKKNGIVGHSKEFEKFKVSDV